MSRGLHEKLAASRRLVAKRDARIAELEAILAAGHAEHHVGYAVQHIASDSYGSLLDTHSGAAADGWREVEVFTRSAPRIPEECPKEIYQALYDHLEGFVECGDHHEIWRICRDYILKGKP